VLREQKARRARPGAAAGEYVHKHLYRMVRACRAGGVPDVVAMYGPVREAARGLRLDPEGVWAQVVVRWDRVETADPAADAMGRALRRAAERPAYLPESVRRRFPDSAGQMAVMAGAACHLQTAAPGRWVPFGSARLAEYLGRNRDTIDAWIQVLEAAGVLAVLRDEDGRTVYDRVAKNARLVRYTGMPLGGE